MQFLRAEIVGSGGETFGDFFTSGGEIAVARLIFGDSKGGSGAMLRRTQGSLVGIECFGAFADGFEREALIKGDFAVGRVACVRGGKQRFGVLEPL